MTDNIVYVAPPHRYVIEKYFGLDDWAAQYSEPDLDKAITGAERQATMTGILHRVIDTQAEPATEEPPREQFVTILNASTLSEVPAADEPAKKTDRSPELVNWVEKIFEGNPYSDAMRGCSCDECTQPEPVNTFYTFSEYQEQAKQTAVYPPDRAFEYLALGLTSEAGEVAGKAKKIIRDHNSILTRELRDDLAAELGDVLWYVAVLADHLGIDLSDVADLNICKLQDRKARGVLGGSGDNR